LGLWLVEFVRGRIDLFRLRRLIRLAEAAEADLADKSFPRVSNIREAAFVASSILKRAADPDAALRAFCLHMAARVGKRRACAIAKQAANSPETVEAQLFPKPPKPTVVWRKDDPAQET